MPDDPTIPCVIEFNPGGMKEVIAPWTALMKIIRRKLLPLGAANVAVTRVQMVVRMAAVDNHKTCEIRQNARGSVRESTTVSSIVRYASYLLVCVVIQVSCWTLKSKLRQTKH
jgi:hypothetical protein